MTMNILLFPPVTFAVSLLFVMLLSGLLSPLSTRSARSGWRGCSTRRGVWVRPWPMPATRWGPRGSWTTRPTPWTTSR